MNKKEEIIISINEILKSLKKQKEYIKQLERIINGHPYIENDHIIKLTKTKKLHLKESTNE